MQTQTSQPDLFKTFEQSAFNFKTDFAIPKQSVTIEPSAIVELSEPKRTFVTRSQRDELLNSPFASFVRGKSLDEINAVDKKLSSQLYKKSKTEAGEKRLHEWWNLHGSAVTVAMEKLYKAVDIRFIHAEKGLFFIVRADGSKQAIEYDYSPFYFDHADNQSRKSFPTHHLEYRSPRPNPISETGYRSDFFGRVPIYNVISFGDFLIKQIRHACQIKNTVIFEGRIYEFNPAEFPMLAGKKKQKKCLNCKSKLDADGDCPNCEPDWEEMPEDDNETE